MQARLRNKQIVLVGAGHTHAHVMRMWAMRGSKNAAITCISDYPSAAYSGMLPAVLAGLLPAAKMTIDLRRFATATGCRLIVDQVDAIDPGSKTIHLTGRAPLPYDLLSIGIGSTPALVSGASNSTALVAIKPMQTFLERLDARLESLAKQQPQTPLRIAIVGGGAGGVEITCCLPPRLNTFFGQEMAHHYLLIDAGPCLLASASPRLSERVAEELKTRGVHTVLGRRVVSVDDSVLTLDDGQELEADLILWCGSASPPPLLDTIDLPKGKDGFLAVGPTLRSVGDQHVFAVGDSASMIENPLPRAGVFAVRQGPILLANLKAASDGKELTPYKAQTDFLRLLNLGDGRAIADWKGFAASGSWAWSLKKRIDARFVDRYQDYRLTPMAPEPKDDDEAMRCQGCGGKVGGDVLRKVLAQLAALGSPALDPRLDHAEDVVAISPKRGSAFAVTTDFFSLPLDDPWLSGRLAALNALSDAWASGAKPQSALAIAAVPEGAARTQERELFAMLAGALCEFEKAGTRLVGGHSIESQSAILGFTVLAEPPGDGLRAKGNLKVGDQLILTKPLGSGVLLAAQMQARCEAQWFDPLLETILTSNAEACDIATRAGLRAATDVTGFGLAGHLLEMLDASGVAARLALDQIPLLPGAASLLAEGLESSLAPSNRSAEASIASSGVKPTDPRYQVLFDPQTSGGLLLGVAEPDAPRLLESLRSAGSEQAMLIGRVEAREDPGASLTVGTTLP